MEQHLPFVRDLARALLLEGDPPDSAWRVFVDEPLTQGKAIRDLSTTIIDHPELTAIIDLFCHLYLPVFVHSCRVIWAYTQRPDAPSDPCSGHVTVLATICDSPLFARFMRISVQAHGMFQNLVRFFDWSQTPPDFDESMDIELCYSHLGCCTIMHKVIVCVATSPSATALLATDPLSPSAHRALRTDAERMPILPNRPGGLHRGMHRRIFEFLTSRTALAKIRADATPVDLVNNDRFVWDDCEWKGKDPNGCIVLKDGEEMMCCSQCQAVRYCSRKHQKEHWKRGGHKEVCRTPLW